MLIGIAIGAVVLVGAVVGYGIAIDASDGSIDAFDDTKWDATGGDGIIEAGDAAYESPATTTTTLPPAPTTTVPPSVSQSEARVANGLLERSSWVTELSAQYEDKWPNADMPDDYRTALEQHHSETGDLWYTLSGEYPDSPVVRAYRLLGNAHKNWMTLYSFTYGLGESSDDTMMYSGMVHTAEAMILLDYYDTYGERHPSPQESQAEAREAVESVTD